MNEQALFDLCCCYLNTTYLWVEDFVELYWYDSLDEKMVEKWAKIMKPIRDNWFATLDNNDWDGDLEWHAKVLTRNLEALMHSLK